MRSGVPPTSSLHPLRGPFAEQNLRLKPGRRVRWGEKKKFKKTRRSQSGCKGRGVLLQAADDGERRGPS